MTIASIQADNGVVLRITGRLDAVTASEFENACKQCIGPETRKVVMDFDGVAYISSAGLRAILLVGKTVQAGGGALVFSGLHDNAKAVLEMAGFCTMFPVYDSVEVALQSH